LIQRIFEIKLKPNSCCARSRESQNPNGKTTPQIGATKSSKMFFDHRNRHKCVVRALSQQENNSGGSGNGSN
jgi:hypothetical protein